VIGLIEPSRTMPPVIVAPAEVRAGERFVVTVNTVGSSDCTTADGGDADVAPDLIRLVPYDIVPLPGRHYFPLELTHAGSSRIRVVGRRPSTDPTALDSVETSLLVAP
jgi:hypothetical protein